MRAAVARHAGDVAVEQPIEPRSGASSPVIRLNSVVLPAPFGPMISRRSPGSTARLTLAVTRRPPNDLHRLVDGERGHGARSSASAAAAGVPFSRAFATCQAQRHSRTVPGTSPSGMKLMMTMKMTPSTRFQRST